MAVTDLGTQTVALPYRWYSYDPIELRTDRYYGLYLTVTASDFNLVYSTFSVRLSGTTNSGESCVSEPLILAEAVSDVQVLKLNVFDYWDRTLPFTLQVARNIFFSNLSNLVDPDVNLRIDPTEQYNF